MFGRKISIIVLPQDDTILFFEASRLQAKRIKVALELYGAATGQSLNYDKCSMLFGESCPLDVKEPYRSWRYASVELASSSIALAG